MCNCPKKIKKKPKQGSDKCVTVPKKQQPNSVGTMLGLRPKNTKYVSGNIEGPHQLLKQLQPFHRHVVLLSEANDSQASEFRVRYNGFATGILQVYNF